MSFDDRLRQAIERGQKRGEARAHEAQKRAMTEEECKRLHSQLRLRLSEQIEACIKRLPNVFPGFQYETIYGDKGWGGACFRDDLRIVGGQRSSNYSRLAMTVRPSRNVLPQRLRLEVTAMPASRAMAKTGR